MTVIFVVYGVFGGFSAAIFIDFIQGVLIIIFLFLLLPLILNVIDGFEGLRVGLSTMGDAADALTPNAQKLNLVAPANIGVFYIAVIAINALVGIVAQPQMMANCAAGKTEMEGRAGYMTGKFLKRLCTIPWCLTGVAAVVYFAGESIHPDEVFGIVANRFLPKIMSGILGVFIAGIMASVMSTCDALKISTSVLFTENIYKPLKSGCENKHYILIGRIACVGIVAGSILYAY